MHRVNINHSKEAILVWKLILLFRNITNLHTIYTETKRNSTVSHQECVMTHDFLFRNVYKKPRALSDEKKNHPTSHYRYRFHNSNKIDVNTKKKTKSKNRQK